MKGNWIGLCILLGCVVGLVSCATTSQEVDECDALVKEPVVVVSKNQAERQSTVPPTPVLVTPVVPEPVLEEVVVEEVIDGDTMDMRRADGSLVRVRVNTIDAAERGLPYWLQSTERLEDLVLGEHVWLETEDVASQPYFRRGKRRLLRDVFMLGEDGSLVLVSEILVEEGLVWVNPMPQSKKQLKLHPKNRKYLQRLLDAQERARDAYRGIWHGNAPKTTRADNSIGPRFILLPKMGFYDILCEL